MDALDACIAKYSAQPYFKSFPDMVGCVVELVGHANSAILEDAGACLFDVVRDKLVATNTKLPILGEYDKNQTISFIRSSFPKGIDLDRLCKDGEICITPLSGLQWVSWEKIGTGRGGDQPKKKKAKKATTDESYIQAFISEDRTWEKSQSQFHMAAMAHSGLIARSAVEKKVMVPVRPLGDGSGYEVIPGADFSRGNDFSVVDKFEDYVMHFDDKGSRVWTHHCCVLQITFC